jgi:hypothetical protein
VQETKKLQQKLPEVGGGGQKKAATVKLPPDIV